MTGLIVTTQQRDGARASLSDWGDLALTEQTPARRAVTPVDRAQVPALLGERFGLEGFDLTADGHLELPPASCPPHHLR